MPRKKVAAAVPKPPKPRRARGTGSIFPDKRRGGYVAKVPIGRYPDGSTKYTEVRAPTQAGVVEKMKLVAPPDPNTVTIGEWATRWVAGLSVRDSTRDGYVRQIDSRIVPSLGTERLSGLSVSAVRAALNTWATDGIATANRTLQVGATMVQSAILDGLATRNVFAECPKLKYEPKALNPFTPGELRAVIDARDRYSAGPLLAFLAGTGARIGEAAALDVGDYDPATGRVSITKTWSRDHGTRGPKSKHSRRTITVPAPVRPAIVAAIGKRVSGPLFASNGSTRFGSAQLHIALNRLTKALGFGRRNPHALRHGVATLLVSRGVPLGDVARYLGHTVAQVVRTYVHATGTDPAESLTTVLFPAA